MKKIALIPVVIVGLIGAVYASTVMFPNTTEFPSMPVGNGTIGGAITNLFNPDGSAKNTEKLNGVTASGYLQNKDCSGEPINNVWVGVDANGVGICGHRITPLASIGKFTEKGGIVQVMKNGTNTWGDLAINDTLYPGDTIKTYTDGTGTIQFTNDLSILRLDTNTMVQLSTGENTDGQSVAEAILSDGQLWGRILTSTGVNLGGGGIVAGVRGTSVDIRKDATGQYIFTVAQSQSSTGAARIVGSNLSGTWMVPKDQIVLMPTGVATKTPKLLSDLYSTTSTWIKTNTNADIEYLTHIIDTTPTNTQVSNELDITIPDTIDELSLLTDNQKDPIEDAETVAPSPATNGVTSRDIQIGTKGKKATCKKYGNKRYWSSLDITGKTKADYCQEKNLVAFVDYTKGNDLYFRDTKGTFTAVSGVRFGGNYTISSAQFAEVQGKRMEFNFPSPISIGNPVINQYLFYAKNTSITPNIEYRKYLQYSTATLSFTPIIPPGNLFNNIFPNVLSFQIGFLPTANTPVQTISVTGRVEIWNN